MSYDLQVGAVGAVITLTVVEGDTPVDLTNADEITFFLKGPKGPRLAYEVSADGDPTDGIIHYATVAGDIAHAGKYQAQARILFADTSEFWTSVYEFTVGPNL